MDARAKKAAIILVEYSTKIKKNDRVTINCNNESKELALEIYRQALRKEAYPEIRATLAGQSYAYYANASEEQLKKFPKKAWYDIKNTDVVIFLGSPENTRELTNIDPKLVSTRQKILRKIQRYRVEKTRWCIFDYPCNALAQEAEMSLEEFEEFVYSSTNIDWAEHTKKMNHLKEIIDKGSVARIIGKDTDITFGIKGRKGVNSGGTHNLPDGEVFTAPEENTTTGYISYTFPAIYGGREVDGVKLGFEKGKVVKCEATKNEDFLKKMISMDKGSCKLGEFGIGTNFGIKKFCKLILFDEKIGGTIHLALGSAYKECGGKNTSGLHWDMIKDLRKEAGGGKIIIDGKVIQEDGKFLI